MKAIKQRRWPLALIILGVIIIASTGIALTHQSSSGSLPVQAVSDGSGGAIVAWQDEKGLHVQHVDAAGRSLWAEGGLTISKAASGPDVPLTRRGSFRLTADGTGGVIITWDDISVRPADREDPAYFDPVPFYAQRISSGGELLWKDPAVAAGRAGLYGGEFPFVSADGTGGAFFAWNNYETYYRALHDDHLRVQRISPDGTKLWGEEGKLLVSSSPYRTISDEEKAAGKKGEIIRTLPTYSGKHGIISDFSGGAILTWEVGGGSTSDHVQVRRLDSRGEILWDQRIDGGNIDYLSESLRSDGEGGVFMVIINGTTGSAYEQRVTVNGELLDKKPYLVDAISDGMGGTIRMKMQRDPETGNPILARHLLYFQRYDTAGSPLWAEEPVLTTQKKYQIGGLEYLADGSGGMIFFWQNQKELVNYGGLFAQRLDAEGNPAWGEKGIAVFNSPDRFQGGAIILSDGSGGVLVAATAGSSAFGGDMVYIQHLDAAGNRLWGDGIRLDR